MIAAAGTVLNAQIAGAVPGATAHPTRRTLACRAGTREIELQAEAIVAINRPSPVTRVPGSAASLLGLAVWRGAPLPVVSLAALLGEPVAPVGASSRVLVLEWHASPVGLLVDGLRGTGAGLATLDPATLLEAARLVPTRPAAPDPPALPVAAARMAPPAPPAARALLLFELGAQTYALPLASVQGVVRATAQIERLPGTDDAMLGAVPFRDTVLPVLSLATLLGQPAVEPTASSRLVLITIGAAPAALLVDAVRGVHRVPEAAIDPVPAVLLRGRAEARIAALARIEAGRALAFILDPDRLLDADTRAGLGTRATPLAQAPAAPAQRHRFVVFELAGEVYGLPIEAVADVLRHPGGLARLPRAPDFVEGALTRRGRVIAVIDPRQRFGAAPAAVTTTARRIIVVALGDLLAGFAVDAVRGVVAAHDAAAMPPIAAGPAALFDRVVARDTAGGMFLAIDPARLLANAERDLLASLEAATS